MQVFISFAHEDEAFAAKLEQALRRRNIGAWSALDLRSGEDWSKAVDEASAKADGFIFLLDAGSSSNPGMLAEWRNVLRNDWESKKPLIPIVRSSERWVHEVPAFLRNRQLLLANDFDALLDRVVYLLQHPAETREHHHDEEGKQDQTHRLEELKEFALALKDDGDHIESGAEHR
jgi:hypothetical protein